MTQPTLAALDLHPGFGESIGFILLGFGLVLTVLAILWGSCALLGKFFKNRPAARMPAADPADTPAPAKPMQATADAMTPDSAEEGRIVAVVSAAVYATLGTHHKIISIRPTGERQAWSVEGRRSIFQSHRIR
jgi:Na+-transporting methylmalonyl-CoA/oxaloacetate decarboxylase gamma subunit